MSQHPKSQASSSRLRKIAAAGAAGAGAAVAKSLLEHAEGAVKKDTGEAIGKIPATIIGGATAGAVGLAGRAILKRLEKKPTIMQSVFGHGGAFRTAIGYGLGAGALGGSLWAGEKAIEHFKEPRDRKKALEVTLMENPHLKHEDQRVVHRSFNTLYNFNPKMAKDPLVAGSFLRRALAFKDEGLQATDVKTLTDIRKNMANAKKDEKPGKSWVERAQGLQQFAPKS